MVQCAPGPPCLALGSEISNVVPKLPVGYSVFHLADVGEPFVPTWRPTYSEP